MVNLVDSDDKYYIIPNFFLNDKKDNIINRLRIMNNHIEYEGKKIFERECFMQKLKPEYWKMKITMRNKYWEN